MHIGIGTKRGSFSISILLTCDITFIFYDGIIINRELANTDVDRHRRWCKVDLTLMRRWNTDAPIWRRQTCQCRSTEAVASTWSWNDRISIWLTQISWTVSLIINGLFFLLV